jgi:hypothetical protein
MPNSTFPLRRTSRSISYIQIQSTWPNNRLFENLPALLARSTATYPVLLALHAAGFSATGLVPVCRQTGSQTGLEAGVGKGLLDGT